MQYIALHKKKKIFSKNRQWICISLLFWGTYVCQENTDLCRPMAVTASHCFVSSSFDSHAPESRVRQPSRLGRSGQWPQRTFCGGGAKDNSGQKKTAVGFFLLQQQFVQPSVIISSPHNSALFDEFAQSVFRIRC